MGRGKRGDIESGSGGGAGLYPGMMETPELRWGFIRKVYTIVTIQLLITAAVAATVTFVRPIPEFFRSNTAVAWVVFAIIIISPILVMLPMMYFRERHPINLFLLGLFTICISFSVGIVCAFTKGEVILEAAGLTMAVVIGLTLYTFWAAKRGHDFSFLGPFLFASLLVLILYGFIQLLFPLGRISTTIYGCLSAIVFSGFIIYDTDNLIKRHTYDEYVSAAISLYLDVINLFIALVTAFDAADG